VPCRQLARHGGRSAADVITRFTPVGFSVFLRYPTAELVPTFEPQLDDTAAIRRAAPYLLEENGIAIGPLLPEKPYGHLSVSPGNSCQSGFALHILGLGRWSA
jgi:hypothetical protein